MEPDELIAIIAAILLSSQNSDIPTSVSRARAIYAEAQNQWRESLKPRK